MIVIILVALEIILILSAVLSGYLTEGFANAGLGRPPGYCELMVGTYYKPKLQDPVERERVVKKVCSDARKNMLQDVIQV